MISSAWMIDGWAVDGAGSVAGAGSVVCAEASEASARAHA